MNWRGCKDIDIIGNGEWSDPELGFTYEGEYYTFNYWEVEDALWHDFLVSNGITEADTYIPGTDVISDEWEQKFDKYCQDGNAYYYLLDCISNYEDY